MTPEHLDHLAYLDHLANEEREEYLDLRVVTGMMELMDIEENQAQLVPEARTEYPEFQGEQEAQELMVDREKQAPLVPRDRREMLVNPAVTVHVDHVEMLAPVDLEVQLEPLDKLDLLAQLD